MKKSVLLLFLLFTGLFSFAQKFTSPDTVAIRKSKVKSVKIYYTGTGSKHVLTHEYHYDLKGNQVFSREGNAGYYYSFSYNEKSQMISSIQRSNSGNVIQGYFYDYYPNGKTFHVKTISERDTINPSRIYTYDTLGNAIEENYYSNGKLTRSFKKEYGSNKYVRHEIDSTPGQNVFETVNSKTVRQTYYNEKNEVIESWKIIYGDKGYLTETICTSGKKTDSYTVVYAKTVDDYHVLKNGKTISKTELVEWDQKFRWLLPREPEEEYGLPYSDPVPIMHIDHVLKYDKNGNITQDKVTTGYSIPLNDPVLFEYEYEYWK